MAREIKATSANDVVARALDPRLEAVQIEDSRQTSPATATIMPRAIVASIFNSDF